MARICRGQIILASTPEVRRVLKELAEECEVQEHETSIRQAEERTAEEIE